MTTSQRCATSVIQFLGMWKLCAEFENLGTKNALHFSGTYKTYYTYTLLKRINLSPMNLSFFIDEKCYFTVIKKS